MTRWTWAYGLARSSGSVDRLRGPARSPGPHGRSNAHAAYANRPRVRHATTGRAHSVVPGNRPGPRGAEAARLLVELWLRDDSLGKAVAALPWVASAPVGEWVPTALGVLTDIADADLELARRVSGYPWLAGGALARDELLAIEALRDIVTADLELGRRAAATGATRSL